MKVFEIPLNPGEDPEEAIKAALKAATEAVMTVKGDVTPTLEELSDEDFDQVVEISRNFLAHVTMKHNQLLEMQAKRMFGSLAE